MDDEIKSMSGEEQSARTGGRSERTARKREKKAEDDKMELYDWIQCIVGALVVGILIFMFCVRVVNVDGSSMWPTLHDEDMILTTDFLYKPKVGDVVVFQTDTYGSVPLVKRIIATEGMTVEIDPEAGLVYVDGKAIDEPYIAETTDSCYDYTVPTPVPEGCLFLMGDNRNHSTDSRDEKIGFVDERCIIGKVLMIVFPSDKGRYSEMIDRDLTRIGSIY